MGVWPCGWENLEDFCFFGGQEVLERHNLFLQGKVELMVAAKKKKKKKKMRGEKDSSAGKYIANF